MMRPFSTHGHAPGRDRAVTLLRLMWVVWLPFLAYPVTGFYRAYPLGGLFHAHITPLHLILTLVGVVLFNALYVWTTWRNTLSRSAPSQSMHAAWSWLPIAILTALPLALILFDGKDWLTLFILTSASAAARLPIRPAIAAVAALVALTAAAGWLGHAGWSVTGPTLFLVGFTGVTVISLVQVVATNRALRAARAEIARLAVADERLRFARDLHDLLGRNLSLIALKSELAGRLAPVAPDRAAAEMRDVEGVAREALRDVRAAVAGYRQPTLESELHGAGEILAAAGIVYQQQGSLVGDPLSPPVEAALAWAVREGVTNVIRHSRARRCTVRLTRGADQAGIEVIDDGHTVAPPLAPSAATERRGSGLAGLAERVAALGGRIESGPQAGGGFRLTVSVPLQPEAINAVDENEGDSSAGRENVAEAASMVGLS